MRSNDEEKPEPPMGFVERLAEAFGLVYPLEFTAEDPSDDEVREAQEGLGIDPDNCYDVPSDLVDNLKDCDFASLEDSDE